MTALVRILLFQGEWYIKDVGLKPEVDIEYLNSGISSSQTK